MAARQAARWQGKPVDLEATDGVAARGRGARLSMVTVPYSSTPPLHGTQVMRPMPQSSKSTERFRLNSVPWNRGVDTGWGEGQAELRPLE